MNRIEIKNLIVEHNHKKNKIIALNDISFNVKDGDFLVLIGPSGSGKTTILHAILGLLDYQGEILINGMDESELSMKERNFAYISQAYVLYPNMTVFENISFPLKVQKVPIDEMKRRVNEIAKTLEIEFLLSRKPKQLSGGQQQRVAIARAMVKNPSLYLFDEPFSNLDLKMRTELRHLLYKLHKQMNVPFIFSTHEQSEAMALASTLLVMNQGRIEQIGEPLEVFSHPVNDFVYEFMHGGNKYE